MWPVLLDMTKEESMQSLRNLELEAYAHLVSALRAQGPLNPDKRKLLKDTSQVLNIPQDRHKAEIRRAVNDEKLNTIAYHVTGVTESLEDWAQEGRRSVPLIPRLAPQTAFSAIADEAADNANQTNKLLPHPASTERKRPPSQPAMQVMPETSKGASFRIPDTPKNDESKKRKMPICTENSSLAQHLLGPPKMSRTQQIYRQRMKGTPMKEQLKMKPQPTKVPFTPIIQSSNGPKVNVVQNVAAPEETIEQIQNEINSYSVQKSEAVPSCSNENQAPRPKVLAPVKPAPSLTFKQIATPTTTPGPSDLQKTVKVCPKKTVAKPGTPMGQKLIVVSNAQTIPSSSILQKTLSIPLVKNISVKNLEKFKIVTTSTPQIVTATNNINSLKHKVVTVKTNQTAKKVIPLSLINSKGGIKVLPIGGKIVGKTTTNTTQPLYIVNTMGPKIAPPPVAAEAPHSPSKENGKSSVLGDILKASGVTSEDFDTQIEEFRIPNNHAVESEVQEQVEEEEIGSNDKEDYIILHDGEELVEETEIKSEDKKEDGQLSNVDPEVTNNSENVILEVPNSELTSVSDETGN